MRIRADTLAGSAGCSGARRCRLGEKLISLFKPHADIIVKGSRGVQHGHKLDFATGKSGLILDVVIEAGNPADAQRFLADTRSPNDW